MSEEDNKILRYNQAEKSMKVPFNIYAGLETLFEKMNTCHNDPEKSSTIKINKHNHLVIHFLYTVHLIQQKNKLDYYRSKKCMKNFCLDLREHATEIINYEKKEMIPLTRKEEKKHINKKFAIYAKKDLVLIITIKNTAK